MKTLDETNELVRVWAYERKITINGNPVTQLGKLFEEGGELASGILKHKKDLIKDSVGDMLVVLSGICELEGLTMRECYEAAYEEIKDRKGYLDSNGNFIKESDYK